MEKIEKRIFCCSKRNSMRKFVFGGLVIIAGLLLLAFNLGYLPMEYKHIVFSWQMLLIAIGLINIFGRESYVAGLLLIAVGSFFIIPELKIFNFNFVQLFWPILLIVVGILIILSRVFKSSVKKHKWEPISQEVPIEDGYIKEDNVFSGSKKIIQPGVFKGGKISNVFGGTEIDLSQTTLAEGKTVLNIECIFGGVSLLVPSDWNIIINVKSVMGGFSDKRRIIKPTDDSRQLIIQGSAVFGGGELKSY